VFILKKNAKQVSTQPAELHIEPIKRKIRAECPDVEISVLASTRDNVGGVLYVRNVPTELVRKIRVSVDYIMVQLDDQKDTDLLIVPIHDKNEPFPHRIVTESLI
jgi:hypothetical protein